MASKKMEIFAIDDLKQQTLQQTIAEQRKYVI